MKNLDVEPGEIVYCNLTFVTKSKSTIEKKDALYGRPYDDGKMQTVFKMSSTDDAMFLRRYKIDEDVELIKIEVIKRMGYKVDYRNSTDNFSSAAKGDSDERQSNGTFV